MSGVLHKFNILKKEKFFRDNGISYDLANELLEHWSKRLDPLLNVDEQFYFDYALFFLSMRENIFAVTIYDHIDKKTQFEYGIMNIFPETGMDITDPNSTLNTVRIYRNQEVHIRKASLQTADRLRHFTIWTATTTGYRIRPYWLKLKYLFSIYYIHKFRREEDKTINFFADINKSIFNAFDFSDAPQKCVCLTYFSFGPLKDYVSIMGESFVTECDRYIFTNIKEKAPENSELYILSAEDYLLISPNATKEELKETFYRMSFKMRGLLITYQIKFFTLKQKMKDIASVWDEIMIS